MTVRAQEPGTRCTGKIPVGAISLSLNVTTVGATSQSFLTIWAGGTRPDASSLNPSPGAPPTPNAVTVDLSVDQTFDIYNNLGNVNVVVDINGYYENHDHDDRYPTDAEVDSSIATAIDEYATRPWSIPIAPSDLHNPSITEFWPATTFGSGVTASGTAFNDGIFGRAWYGFTLPASYSAGSDVAVDMRYLPVSGFGVPVLPCDSVWWSNAPIVNRPGESGFSAGTTWATPRGFDVSQTRLAATQAMFDASRVAETTMTIAGTNLRPGDQLNLTLNRDGDEADDTCEGMMITGLTVRPAD